MTKEKRKYFRFACPLPVHLIQVEGGKRIVRKAVLNEISREGLKLTSNFSPTLKPGSEVKFKLNIPDKQLLSRISGEVVWTKLRGKKSEVGVQIRDMDKGLKSELMDLAYSKWRESREKEASLKKP